MRRFALLPLLAALAGPAAAAAEADAPPRPVAAPHYGDVLFHFYQGRSFTSMTSLLVSQQFTRLAPHDDDAEVLRGGLLLAYGVHDEAEAIFTRLIERGTTAAVRDRAWFFLAKLRFQRGLDDGAEAALRKVGSALPPALEDERVLLLAQLQMARGDNAAAVTTLNPLAQRPLDKKRPEALAPLYAQYNQGIALIASGDLAAGQQRLAALGALPSPFEEMRALRDKANLALGFASLRAEKPEEARAHLQRVRLAGLQSNKALLGFGWAAAALKQHESALAPWMELLQRDAADAAVLEARIAVPYAYAEFGAFGQAQAGYTEAVAAYERETAALDESAAAVRSGKMVAALMARHPGEEMGWAWSLEALPEMPHPAQLAPVLARHEFQEAFKNYRDLEFLVVNLRGWVEKLVIFDDMLANRRQAYAERLPQWQERAKAVNVATLEKRAETLAAELRDAEAAADGRALADARQLELLATIARARGVLARAGAEKATDDDSRELAERLRRAEGALTWDLAQAFPERLWQAQKGLRDTGRELAAAREHEALIAQIPKDEPQKFEAYAARMKTLAQRVNALLPGVVALAAAQREAVHGIAVAELTRQQQRLAEYTAQARFALAQLYDRAQVAKKEGGDAPQ